jgi:tight adherence protein C
MMGMLQQLIDQPFLVYLALVAIALIAFAYMGALCADKILTARRRVHKRVVPLNKLSKLDRETRERNVKSIASQLAEKTKDLYAASDPHSTRKLKIQLIRGGYFQPNAAGVYLFMRPIFAAGLGLFTFVYVGLYHAEWTVLKTLLTISGGAFGGYMLPQFYLSRRIKKLALINRQGFPDFMDLMIVCVEAGLSMEAAISRIATEIESSYPNLAMHLSIAALEVRSGRTLEDSLEHMADRIGIDDVKSFATLLKQSKELGTSLAGALKVYSDDMRDKRMSLAEEKAHALPAKMSVPVTLCILPVILIIAALPVAFKVSTGG